MTQKLFYEDSYIREFEAVVTGCNEGKGRFEIILDRTAFYPEGGGQPGDTGFLTAGTEKIEITDTHEKGEDILHYAAKPLEIGSKVRGTINWQRRFDHMQNHSGEHIVSGLINAKYGYNNVGFHMGSDFITIDFDGEFPAEELSEFERKANERVWADSEVDIKVYNQEEIKSVDFRSKKELTGDVRIVTFPDADVCACCGTHVKRTGEIGLIKLISIVRNRGGVKIEMLCGRRALEYISAVCAQNTGVSVALSAKPLETHKAVMHLKDSAASLSYRIAGLEEQQFKRIAEEYKDAGDVLLFEDGLSAEGVRKLCVQVMESCKGRCAVFSGSDDEGYKYALGEEDGDLRELVKSMNQSLGGRGGGKPFFAQGSVAASKQQIESFFA